MKRRIPALAPSWVTALATFELERRAAGLTAESIRVELGHLSRMARVLPDPWAIQAEDLRGYAGNACWAPNTAHRFRTAVRSFYTWAEHTGRVDDNPAPAAAIPAPGAGWLRRPDEFPTAASVPDAWSAALTAWSTYSRAAGRSTGTIGLYLSWLLRLADQYSDPWS